MGAQTYRDLVAWKFAMDFVERVYRATRSFPQHEVYGLRSQLRRASVSIPSNIAEGSARRTRGEFLYQLSVAQGSLAEVQTQIEICERLGYFEAAVAADLMTRSVSLAKLMNALRTSLTPSREAGTPTTNN